MNYYLVTDGQTESDAYEPTVQFAQVGSKITQILEKGKNRFPRCLQKKLRFGVLIEILATLVFIFYCFA